MKTLMVNSMVLIVAGSDTAATLLSGLIYLLLKNPGCLHKITHEVRSTFSSEDEICFSSVQNLPYSMFHQVSPSYSLLCKTLLQACTVYQEPNSRVSQCSPVSKRPSDAIRPCQAPLSVSCRKAVRISPAGLCQRGPS